VAPFDGTVTSLDAVPGQVVGAGSIIRIASTHDLLVRIYLDETDVDKAVLGNQVQLTFDAYPDLLLEGTIVTVEPVLDFVDGTPVVVIWTDLPAAPEHLTILAGMTVDAEVIAHEALGALLIPIQALRELEPGSYAVFVVQEDGTLVLTPVTTGLRDYANVQILSGLQAGDVVSTGIVETR
jgi:multidrug efflux pump subunit AcrA (membrane-fusion protein)